MVNICRRRSRHLCGQVLHHQLAHLWVVTQSLQRRLLLRRSHHTGALRSGPKLLLLRDCRRPPQGAAHRRAHTAGRTPHGEESGYGVQGSCSGENTKHAQLQQRQTPDGFGEKIGAAINQPSHTCDRDQTVVKTVSVAAKGGVGKTEVATSRKSESNKY